MTTIFHDMIHKEIEVYVDDVIVKSKKATDHMEVFQQTAKKKDAATKWTNDCQKAFDRIKEYLLTPPVLVLPEPAHKLRHYFCAYTTYLISRMDPLKYIFQKPMPTGKLAKWQILLSEFYIVYITHKAINGHALADHLAENPMDREYEPLKTYFLDEEVSFIREDIAESYDGWRMFIDGSANFKRVGIGAVVVSKTGYRTIVCTSTGATPYMLVYSIEVVIPVEVEILSLRIIQEADLDDTEWVKNRYKQLAIIDGRE
ncbi:uncharacterized protein [Nicotiana sylvestris]|uniref:uncharacterized protein n=1 Tax=Nicotiana sylvestris TaxID=4096 RepID=UPI00388C5051